MWSPELFKLTRNNRRSTYTWKPVQAITIVASPFRSEHTVFPFRLLDALLLRMEDVAGLFVTMRKRKDTTL
jgi:hypothetical protein